MGWEKWNGKSFRKNEWNVSSENWRVFFEHIFQGNFLDILLLRVSEWKEFVVTITKLTTSRYQNSVAKNILWATLKIGRHHMWRRRSVLILY